MRKLKIPLIIFGMLASIWLASYAITILPAWCELPCRISASILAGIGVVLLINEWVNL